MIIGNAWPPSSGLSAIFSPHTCGEKKFNAVLITLYVYNYRVGRLATCFSRFEMELA